MSKISERKIVRLIYSSRHQTEKSVNVHIKNQENVQVSADTIRKNFSRAGLKARIKERNSLLKPEHKKIKLEFASKIPKLDYRTN